MSKTKKEFDAARRRMGMTRQEPDLRPAYTHKRKPTVIAGAPGDLTYTVEVIDGDQTRVVARAENIALARGAFDCAMRMWPDRRVRLCQGAHVYLAV